MFTPGAEKHLKGWLLTALPFQAEIIAPGAKYLRFLHKNAQKSHFSCYKSQRSLYSSITNMDKHKRTVHFSDLHHKHRKSKD